MGWLGKWFGAREPTLEALAGEAARSLRERGSTDVRIDLERGCIDATLAGESYRLNLANLFAEWRAAKPRERPAVVDRYLTGIADASAAKGRTTSYADVRAELLPVLRSEAMIGNVALVPAPGAAQAGGDRRMATRPFVADLVVALVHDRPTSMAFVMQSQLEQWQLGFEQVLDDALQNLRRLPEHGGWQAVGDGVWSGEWGDAYEPSRLLLPDLVHRLGVRRPVALAPFNNAVLVTDADNPAGLARIAAIVGELRSERGRWLSFQPLALVEREWRRFELPAGPLREAFGELQFEKSVSDYAEQKQLLDAHHQAQGVDVFVAACQGASKEGAGLVRWTTWADGVHTLLPVADLLAFAWRDGEGLAHVTVPWVDARRIVGALMEPTEHLPLRYRVRAFPDAAMLAELKAHAAL